MIRGHTPCSATLACRLMPLRSPIRRNIPCNMTHHHPPSQPSSINLWVRLLPLSLHSSTLDSFFIWGRSGFEVNVHDDFIIQCRLTRPFLCYVLYINKANLIPIIKKILITKMKVSYYNYKKYFIKKKAKNTIIGPLVSHLTNQFDMYVCTRKSLWNKLDSFSVMGNLRSR